FRVSSSLDKSVGKQFLTDGSPETCWTSTQGLPQFIQLTFRSPVIPKRASITFQGGFVGTRCRLEVPESGDGTSKSTWKPWTEIFPEDVNRAQTFDLVPDDTVLRGVGGLRLVFEQSSDFFGRITVYDLQLLGTVI
ncbi:galactose-binding like protein, partial [Cristinia sonorae]